MIRKILFTLVMVFVTSAAVAQSSADKLFIEGQKLQKSLTLASQNNAIKKFQAAKVVYTTADKKTMCDNQISICRNNIKSIKSRSTARKKAVVDEPEKEEVPEPVVDKHVNVELALSETRLDFKYKPKDGATQSVEVKCNYDDWEITAKPDWVEVYTSKEKFSVEAHENKDEESRSGVLTVKCGDKEVDLVINQASAKAVDKIMGGVKGLFNKKKKK